jgi:hypothetical protein
MNRWTLVIIPFATCALVSTAVFVVGAPEEPTAALLYGGATEGQSVQAWSLEVTRRVGASDKAVSPGGVVVEVAEAGGQWRRWRGVTRRGRAEVAMDLGRPAQGPLEVVVRDPTGATLGRGRVFLSRSEWLERARRSGGWLEGDRAGALEVGIAPGRGAFAAEFAEPLWVRVRRQGAPSAGARVKVASEGADVSRGKQPDPGPAVDSLEVLTDPNGLARLYLRPRGFDVALTVTAEGEEGATGRWSGALPVVAGALDAQRRGQEVIVTSSIPRETAFVSFVSDRGRWAGGELLLEPTRSGATASIPLPPTALGESPLWAVVAADPHVASSGAVGWPIGAEPSVLGDPPPVAMTVADQLLLDGRPLVRAREAARQHKARVLAGAFAGVAMTSMAILVLSQTTGARHRLEQHLAGAGQSAEEVRRVTGARHWIWISVLAVFLIALGYAIVALSAMARIR